MTPDLKTPRSPDKNFIKNLFLLRKNALNFLLNYSEKYSGVVKVRIGVRPTYFLTRPDHIKHVFVDNFRNYNKDTRGWKKIKILLRDGVFVTSGSLWQRQRRTMQPVFHPARTKIYAKVMEKEVEGLNERWNAFFKEGKSLNLHSEMMRITLRVIAKTMFSEDIESKIDDISTSLNTVLKYIEKSYLRILDWPLSIPSPGNNRLKKAIKVLDDIVFSFIKKRKQGGAENNDLLSILMKVQDPETGKVMNDYEIRDQVMTILLAGHETTANSLTFGWWLLSQNPSVEQKLNDELQEVLGGRSPNFEDLQNLSYSTNVFKEALRLYPPVWIISRNVIEEDAVGGYRIPSGSTIFVSPYCLHRHPEFWKNPEKFYPDRFSEWGEPSHDYAYIPFGSGPRMCMGKDFAMAEMVMILATLAQQFKLHPESSTVFKMDRTVTLRPKHEIAMKIEKK